MRNRLLGMLMIISGICYSQSPQLSLPTVIPPSPAAGELTKYINYPVDLSNGLVKISIPLYEIVDGDISIPITLNYHASGIKPNIYSNDWLGDGWSLSTGPSLSRTINGGPDECFYDYSLIANSQPNYDQLNTVANQSYDITLDEFYYSLLNTSGRLYFKRDINNNLKPVTIPIDPIKITLPVANKYDNFINISDTKGLQYFFGGSDTRFEDLVANQYGSTEHNVPTAWKINKIYSPLTNRTVSFDYYPNITQIPFSQTADAVVMLDNLASAIGYSVPVISVSDANPDNRYYTYNSTAGQFELTDFNILFLPQGYVFPSTAATPITQYNSYIKTIRFSGGYMVFTKNENGGSGLTSIRVYDNNNSLVKQIEFVQYVSGTPGCLILSKLKITSPAASDVEQYSFLYNDFVLNKDTRSLDKWGYYNGANNTTLVPTINTQAVYPDAGEIVPVNIPGGNREPNETAMQAGMLTGIIYPTGGETNFIYEAHRYQDGNGKVRLAGGLRIKQIRDIDGNGNVKYRNFQYSTLNSSINGIGLLNVIPTGNINPSDSNFIYYSEVKCLEFTPNTPSLEASYFERRWYTDSMVNLFSENGSSVSYPYVTETTSSDSGGTQVIGEQQHCFNVSSSYPIKDGNTNMISDTRDGWSKGNLISATTGKNNAADSFDTVAHQELSSVLQPDSDVNKITQWYAYKGVRFYGASENIIPDSYKTIASIHQDLSAGKQLLSHQYDYTYSNNGTVKQTTDYSYDTYWNAKQISRSTSVSSTGKDIVTYAYAKDKVSQGLDTTGIYAAMVNDNIVSIPVEVKRYKNSVVSDSLLTTLTTNYSGFNKRFIDPPLIAPREIISKVKNDPNVRRIGFNYYDNHGNILEQQNIDGTKDVYLWGYWGQHPVAKIVGSDFATVKQKVDTSSLYAGDDTQIKQQFTNLRNGFSSNPNVQISTFTYKPFIGMTTATDPQGVTTNYTYDTFNRLYLVRNDDENILGRYRYGYQNAPDNGMGGYAALSTSSIKTNYSSYIVNTTGTATVGVTGGSGNYSYQWTLINTGTPFSTTTQTSTVPSITFTCPSQAAEFVIQCAISDNVLGFTTSASTGVWVASSAYSWQTGFASSYNSIAINGSTVNMYFNFYPTAAAMQTGTTYLVANIMPQYCPSATRNVTYTVNGRTWYVSIYSNGNMYITIQSGSSLPVNSGVTLNISYAL
jgi:hypothetical protein